MDDILQKQLVPSGAAMASRVGEETVILQSKSGTYFGLDTVGTKIWELLEKGQTPASICIQLADEYDVTPEVIEADLQLLIKELEAHGLIMEPGRADD